MNFVDELRWRGMIHTMMPGTEELLKKEMVTAYLGIDPTADPTLRPQAAGTGRRCHWYDWRPFRQVAGT